MVYVIDYSEDDKKIYRIGKTDNMNRRKAIYDTHTLNKRNVVHYVEHTCPIKLESCARFLLHDYRYQNNRDFYECDLERIKNALEKCVATIKCEDGINHKISNDESNNMQSGGSANFADDQIERLKIRKSYYHFRIKFLELLSFGNI